jgi:ubiquinone/menaquinone biosynthesis C-methylase UbiE
MGTYEGFAEIYSRGNYGGFSTTMAETLPDVLKDLEFEPKTILDVACGDGTFAVAMAEKGYRVTGLDISEYMLEYARLKVEHSRAHVDLVLGDMRALRFDAAFDLTTCWFDSLNYLLDPADLRATLDGIYRALRHEGLFIFDMNTIYGLAVNWREHPVWVQHDDDRIFEVHRAEYDFEANIAIMRITGFIKDGPSWRRIDEEHRERAYSQAEVREYLEEAGFQVLACWGSLSEMSEPTAKSGRIWYVAKKTPE